MPTSDEVWARGCPPRNHNVLVLAQQPVLPELRKAFEEGGYKTSVRPINFAGALRAVEDAGVVVIDLLAAPQDHLFLAGYAIARGKTMIGYAAMVMPNWLLAEAVYVTRDMDELRAVVTSLGPRGAKR